MKMTKEEVREAALLLHNILVDIRDKGAECQDAGICFNVDQHDHLIGASGYQAVVRLLKVLTASWPRRHRGTLIEVLGRFGPRVGPGGRYYPVGGPGEYEREQDSGTLWLNPRRIELLEWLINRTEELSNGR